MTPKSAVQKVLEKVEAATGYAVTVQDDQSLGVLATVKAAHSGMPFTLIRVRPDTADIREYTVCYQCGFVLRQAMLTAGQRWEIAVSPKGRLELDRIVRKSAAGKLGQTARSAFVENMLGGLIVQLRSVPIGLRIDQWIQSEFPALVDQQRESTERQLEANVGVLSPNIRRMAPEPIYQASASMNAAVAVYWAALWGDNTKLTPYKVSGFSDAGNALIHRLHDASVDPESDRSLIESWAAQLGISGWCEFITR